MTESEVKVKSKYPCGRCGPKGGREEYRATGNEAPHAHLCAHHYFELDVTNRLMYVPVTAASE